MPHGAYMVVSDIKKTVEALCESLVLTTSADAVELANVRQLFEQVLTWAKKQPEKQIEKMTRAAADLLDKVIFSEVEDAQSAMDVVGKAASLLQAFISDEIPVGELTFPSALGLSDGDINGGSESGSNDAAREQKDKTESEPGVSDGAIVVKLPGNVDKAIFEEFLSMQAMSLEEMETLILDLESGDDEKLAELRRMFHTLKGESGLLGLSDVEELCHATEDAMDKCEPRTMVDVLLGVKDWFGKMFHAYGGTGQPPVPLKDILATLLGDGSDEREESVSVDNADGDVTVIAQYMPVEESEELRAFLKTANERLEAVNVHLLAIEAKPDDGRALDAIYTAFYQIGRDADSPGLTCIVELMDAVGILVDKARQKKFELSGLKLDVVFDTVEMARRLADSLEGALQTGGSAVVDSVLPGLLARINAAQVDTPEAKPDQMLGEIMVDSGKATEEQVRKSLDQQDSVSPNVLVGEILVRESGVAAKDVGHALRSQKAAREKTEVVQVREKVKVDSQRLDSLVDTIGELVIAEAMVSQSVNAASDETGGMARLLNELDKITRELQSMASSMRMVPVRATFQRMARLVREVSKKTGRQVEFVMSGEDTELDKSVVDLIKDPLVHMVRNAVDHGIETDVEARRAAGKSDVGRVELHAFHKGGLIYIEVSDDGQGLDKEKIQKKAIERGIINENDVLTDSEMYNLIFAPGFTTATAVSDISGRGVGLDVVRQSMEKLRGQMDVTSQKGKGSVFSIRLPLTMAIIEGMIVRVGEDRFIIPTLSIVRVIKPDEGDITTVFDRGRMLKVGEEMVPLYYLADVFGVENAERDMCLASVVMIEYEDSRFAIVVDELIGQQQIVIKPLGETLKNVKGLSGGAIMPDGRVGLIIDVGGLAKIEGAGVGSCHKRENSLTIQ